MENGSYDLETIDATEPFDGLSLPVAIETPGPITVYTPDIDSSTVPYVDQFDFGVSWDTTGSASYVLMELYRYEGDVVVDEVHCWAADDGSFTVPSSVWSGWSYYDQVTIIVGRAQVSDQTLYWNGADDGMLGVNWVIGAGYQY